MIQLWKCGDLEQEVIADKLIANITLEQAGTMVEMTDLHDTDHGKALERLLDKIHAVNHNINGGCWVDVNIERFTGTERYLVRVTIYNFLQNEPQNVPPAIIEVIERVHDAEEN